MTKLLPWLWAVVVAALVVHSASLWWSDRLVIDTDMLALLPAEQRDAVLERAFARMVDANQQTVIVLIGASGWKEATRAADAYSGVLAPHGNLIARAAQIDHAAAESLASLGGRRVALLTPEDEAALRSQPEQFWVDAALAKLYSPFPAPKLTPWREDPFGLFANWIYARAQETPVRPRDGRLSVGGGARDYIVLPFTLKVPAFSLEGQQAVIPLLEQARHAATTAVAGGAEVIQAGVVLHAAAAAEQARREMSLISAGSLAGVVLLTWLTFHSLKPIALITVTIFIGFLGALSISSLLFHGIHVITLVFGASLIGVAEDYGIYFLCKRSGAGGRVDSRQLLRHILPALLLALITSVIGYMALALTPFPGLRQMAVFSVTGLIFAWLTVVFWFPALVRASPAKNQTLLARYGSQLTRWPLLHYERRPLLTVFSFAGLALLAWACLDVRDDIRSLQNSPKKLIDDQIQVSNLLDLPAPAQMYVVRGESAETVLQREEMLKQRLDALVGNRQISGYHAISNWVPSARLQAARRQLVERSLAPENGALWALASRLGEDDSWAASTRAKWLGSPAAFRPEDFLGMPASGLWRNLWLGKVGGEYAAMVAVRGVTKDNLAALEAAGASLPGVQWVDKVGQISAVMADYRRYISWLLLISLILVYGLLYLRYRQDSWRVLTPTVLATVATLAILGISGQALQLFHVLGLMLVLGIGVDYGIFFQEPGRERDDAAWLAAGVSALSTLLSFGLLALSRTPALQAFGLTLAIGVAAVTLIVPCFRREVSATSAA